MTGLIGKRKQAPCRAALALLLSCALSPAAAKETLLVLSVDAEYLESGMPLYGQIGAQLALIKGERDAIALAIELRRSEVLTALPEAIAKVAQAANADLVLDRSVAERAGEPAARDITPEVERILVAQFGQRALEIEQ